MKAKKENTKLPLFFKPLLWSYRFSAMDTQEDKERIIINTINYGNWRHWQWIIDCYGKKNVKEMIKNTPASEFRKGSLRLISLLLDIKKMMYASRGIKIRATKSI